MLDLNSLIIANEPLSKHNSYRTGGRARFFAAPKSSDELRFVLDFSEKQGLKKIIIGRGTNLLFDDEGFDGIVISTKNLNRYTVLDGCTVLCGAGVLLDDLVAFTVAYGLSGLENLSGIPGTVGGAIFMNAGAFDCEVKDTVAFVDVLKGGVIARLYRDDIAFEYRKTSLKDEIVLSVSFLLNKKKEPLGEIREDILKRRSEKQPLEYPSCGSVFKRPFGTYAGKLIEECGLKGYTIGGAQVSEKHANFIINMGNATSSDIKKLISFVKEKVFEKFGVVLEEEVKIIGK
ncbi:MAG: UDP-N-acetylmuramate dehydrogenase [Calditerrivibrio sp.]|nr:UDP-N-acetylmuramate dehydrogenase [Calditerrivibrio sp.]